MPSTPAPTSLRRRAPGWLLVATSIVSIGLVLLQMSNPRSLSTLRPEPPPPMVEATPTLWTPRVGQPPSLAPAPAPAPAPKPDAPSAPPGASRTPLPAERIRAVVMAWAQAWESRDASAYLAFYAEGFPKREEFARQKQRVMGRARFIEIRIEQLRLNPIGNGQTEAKFIQTYRSDSFENQSLKRQVWQEGPTGRLEIIEEAS